MVSAELVGQVPFLNTLDEGARSVIAARSSVESYREGDIVWLAGDRPRGLFIVLEGEVRIVRAWGGRQHVVHTETAGGTLGEVPLFEGGGYPATAVAGPHTRCLVIQAAALREAIEADPELAWTLLRGLSERIRHLVDRLHRTTLLSVRARLCAHLLSESAPTSPRRASVRLTGTQEQLAEELGTVREVVVRELAAPRKSGAIRQVDRETIELLDFPALEAIAHEEPIRRAAGA